MVPGTVSGGGGAALGDAGGGALLVGATGREERGVLRGVGEEQRTLWRMRSVTQTSVCGFSEFRGLSVQREFSVCQDAFIHRYY